jgi:hypothetical protein
MKLRMFVVLAGAMLALSACVIEPYGGGGRGPYYGGGGGIYIGGEHDYGRPVWRH